MKTRIALVLGVLVWAAPLGAQDSRAPSMEELSSGLFTAAPVRVVDGGSVVDRVSVSPDGQWLVYAYFGENIRNNHLRLVAATDGSRREIASPAGFKHTPVIRNPGLLYFTLDSHDPHYQDGIYFGPWDGPADRWTLFEAGTFWDLALSEDGQYLAASTGNDNRRPVRSTVRVWRLGSSGERSGPGYPAATGVAGQVRQIAWGPQSQSLVVEINIEKAGREWGQSNLYIAENRSGAPARLLRADGEKPVFGVKNGFSVLFFQEGDWQKTRVLALRPGDPREAEAAAVQNQDHLGLTANGMAWDPVGRRLILGVQASAAVAGLVAFSPP